jgi:hypothetical protein
MQLGRGVPPSQPDVLRAVELGGISPDPKTPMEYYQATLESPEEKRGELFVAVDKAAWDAMFPAAKPKPAPPAAGLKPKLWNGRDPFAASATQTH